MTNKEKIQKMDTDELSQFLLANDDCDMCIRKDERSCLYFTDNTDWQCKEGIAEWLEEEANG